MAIQIIKGKDGLNTGVFVPIEEWITIIQKHEDLKNLVDLEQKPKRKISELAGTLSPEAGEALLKHVADSRNEWEERFNRELK
ncbi:MAG: hypothetical protein SFU91_07660 [Chloroherpetonaceae bacterium]|nr:hypothetical protein [Chloroherpetonaceae bacterium]